MCQKSYVWICCVFVKNGEWWSCDLMNLEWFHEWLLLLMLEKHVVDELVCWVWHGWIDDESCCCYWIILKVWWNLELEQNNVWFLSFKHFGVCVYVHDLQTSFGMNFEC